MDDIDEIQMAISSIFLSNITFLHLIKFLRKLDLPQLEGPAKIKLEPIFNEISHIFIFYKNLCKNAQNNMK